MTKNTINYTISEIEDAIKWLENAKRFLLAYDENNDNSEDVNKLDTEVRHVCDLAYDIRCLSSDLAIW